MASSRMGVRNIQEESVVSHVSESKRVLKHTHNGGCMPTGHKNQLDELPVVTVETI